MTWWMAIIIYAIGIIGFILFCLWMNKKIKEEKMTMYQTCLKLRQIQRENMSLLEALEIIIEKQIDIHLIKTCESDDEYNETLMKRYGSYAPNLYLTKTEFYLAKEFEKEAWKIIKHEK